MSSRGRPSVGLALLILTLATLVCLATAAMALAEAEKTATAPNSQVASWSKSKVGSLIRKRRLAVPPKKKNNNLANKQYQACKTADNKPGHCKHLSSCGDEVYRENNPELAENMCVIENEFIGVCCPDDATGSPNARSDSAPFRFLAGYLPAVVAEGKGDDKNKQNNQSKGDDDIPRDPRVSTRGCGVSSRDQSRVTGGRPTSSREWPWVAALLRSGEQYCGGVLITDRHVLTAAHCVHRRKPREITVRLGEYDLRYPNETRALDFKVLEIRIHNGYVATTYKHDIAILKIHRPTIFNTYIWPVCLPPVGASLENKQATVIGWGTTSFGGAGSYVLMEVNVPVWPLSECASKFTQEISENHICAGVYTGNGDACQGDSGGPLLHQLANGRWVTVGVVSWGIGCGDPGKPGIYTRVNAYLDWIFANTIF